MKASELIRHLERAHMGLQVAVDILRAAGVALDQLDQVLVDLVLVEQLERRDAQTFARDVGAERLAAGSTAAGIGRAHV